MHCFVLKAAVSTSLVYFATILLCKNVAKPFWYFQIGSIYFTVIYWKKKLQQHRVCLYEYIIRTIMADMDQIKSVFYTAQFVNKNGKRIFKA